MIIIKKGIKKIYLRKKMIKIKVVKIVRKNQKKN